MNLPRRGAIPTGKGRAAASLPSLSPPPPGVKNERGGRGTDEPLNDLFDRCLNRFFEES